jgi:hypothetical protein
MFEEEVNRNIQEKHMKLYEKQRGHLTKEEKHMIQKGGEAEMEH